MPQGGADPELAHDYRLNGSSIDTLYQVCYTRYLEETVQPNNSEPKEKPYQRYRRLHLERVKEHREHNIESRRASVTLFPTDESDPRSRFIACSLRCLQCGLMFA